MLRAVVGVVSDFLSQRGDYEHRNIFGLQSRSFSKPSASVVVDEFVSPQFRHDSDARHPPRRVESDKEAEVIEWWLKRDINKKAVVRIARLDGSSWSREGLTRLRGRIAAIDASGLHPWYSESIGEQVRTTLVALGDAGSTAEVITHYWDTYVHLLTDTYDAIDDFYCIMCSQLRALRAARCASYLPIEGLTTLLRHTPHLRELQIRDRFLQQAELSSVDAFAEALGRLPIETVDFSCCCMEDLAFSRLAPSLMKLNETLVELNLVCCSLTQDSIPMLAAVLRQCSVLRDLELVGNKVVTSDALVDGGEPTCALRRLTALRRFTFSSSDFDTMILDRLAEVIPHWSSIKSLECHSLFGGSAQRFSESVERLTLLQCLTLQVTWHCPLSVFAPLILRLPASLRSLTLAGCTPDYSCTDDFMELVPYFEKSANGLTTLTVALGFTEEAARSVWRRLKVPQVTLGVHSYPQ